MPDSEDLHDPSAAPPQGDAAAEPIDTAMVRRLADILNDTDLTEIEVERGDLKIRVARRVEAIQPMLAPMAAPALQSFTAPAPATAPAASPAAAPPMNDTGPEARGEAVKSPMVGTVYLQSQPGQPLFARVGDRVSAGQTLLIIEAMKTMNPVPAPKAGVVVAILVGDAQPVEFGEPLVMIE